MTPFRLMRRQQRWWINFTGCYVNWELTGGEISKATPVMKQFCRWWPQTIFLSSFCLTVSLHEVVSTTNRDCSGRAAPPGWYPYVPWPENNAVLCLLCWRSYHTTGQYTRRGRGAVGGQRPSSRNATYTLKHMTTWPQIGYLCTPQPNRYLPENTRVVTLSPDRWEQHHAKHMWRTRVSEEFLPWRTFWILQHPPAWLVQWVSDVLGRLSQRWPVCCQVPGWETQTH